MENNNNFFNTIQKKLILNKKVFKPNLTTKLSFETALTEINYNSKILDLGCGSGILGILLKKKKKNLKLFASDIDQRAIDVAKKNFELNKISAELRLSNLFSAWENFKFDYILNDVSGISSIIAKKSPWFSNIVPCDTGTDGTKLSTKIISNSRFFLKKNGILQVPLISLSNVDKTISLAKKRFKLVKIKKSVDWFLPNDLSKLKKEMKILKKKKIISFKEKFGKLICNTSIMICKNLK